jgi:hypothetical protein
MARIYSLTIACLGPSFGTLSIAYSNRIDLSSDVPHVGGTTLIRSGTQYAVNLSVSVGESETLRLAPIKRAGPLEC